MPAARNSPEWNRATNSPDTGDPTPESGTSSKLTADQNENAGHQRNCPGDKADSQSSKCNDADNDQINREQKHSDIFGNHVTSIGNYTSA